MVVNWHIITLWAGVGLYILAFLSGLAGRIFSEEKAARWSLYLLILGFLSHGSAIGIRWVGTGQGPYDSFYDVLVANGWTAVLFLLFIIWRIPGLKVLTLFVMPVVFLMLGSAVLTSPMLRPLPETYATYWLVVHVLFAKLAYGSCLLSFALAALYLWRRSRNRAVDGTGTTPRSLDELSYQFAAFGFINLGIMIASGAIWANDAWGRYWGWDPLETWALVSWFIYGVYLHLRRTMGWRGEKAAWVAIGGFVLMIFTYFAVSFVFTGIHENLS